MQSNLAIESKSNFNLRDGSTQQLAGCLRDFRNKPFPVRAKIEYYQNTLTVNQNENKLRRSKLPQSSPGYMPLYTGSFNSHGRTKSKAQKKVNWYKSKKVKDGPHPASRKNWILNKKKGNQTAKKVQPSTVIFVPNTRGGLLTKKLKEKEDELCEMTGFRVKFQEAGGLQLKN